jgi:hypothetical protein
MELPKDLKDEIWEYCRLNDITDLNAFMVRMLKQGYNIEKYGATPFKMGQKEPEIIEKEIIREVIVEKEVIKEVIVEKEKIVEVIKEVPVEVIKEIIVEKIGGITENRVEVPVEVIKEVIKEVIVEKIVEVPIKNDKQFKELEQQVENLKIELELEKNRNYKPTKTEKPKEENSKTPTSNVISWISKSERDTDLYGE